MTSARNLRRNAPGICVHGWMGPTWATRTGEQHAGLTGTQRRAAATDASGRNMATGRGRIGECPLARSSSMKPRSA